MSDQSRYALYFVPPEESPLWRFGTSIIGYDSVSGRETPVPEELAKVIAPDLMNEPQRYGFHATLRAPFELAKGVVIADLLKAITALAQQCAPIDAGELHADLMGGFVALTCRTDPSELTALAQRCVEHVEPFRAPLSQTDRERRLSAPLTPRQIDLLNRYGYPYVLEQFKFHMTLTGRLPEDAKTSVLDIIRNMYAPVADHLRIVEVTLLEQPWRDARFRVVQRFPLGH